MSQPRLFVPATVRELAHALGTKVKLHMSQFRQHGDGLTLRYELELMGGSEPRMRAKQASLVAWARARGFTIAPRGDSLLAAGRSGRFDHAIEATLEEALPNAGGIDYVLSISIESTLTGARYALARVVRDFPGLTGEPTLPAYFTQLISRYPLKTFSCYRVKGACAHWRFALDPGLERPGTLANLVRENRRHGFEPDPRDGSSYQACARAGLRYEVVDGGLEVALDLNAWAAPGAETLLSCTRRPQGPPPTRPDPPGSVRIHGVVVSAARHARVDRIADCYERHRRKEIRRFWEGHATERGPFIEMRLVDGDSGDDGMTIRLAGGRGSVGIRQRIDERTVVWATYDMDEDGSWQAAFVEGEPEAWATDDIDLVGLLRLAHAMDVETSVDEVALFLRDSTRFRRALHDGLKPLAEAISAETDGTVRAQLEAAYRRGKILRDARGERFRRAALAFYPFAEPGCALNSEP